MEKQLRVLFIEDFPSDVELLQHHLSRNKIRFTDQVVETEEAFIEALESFHPDIILSDYLLPQFDGMQALKIRNDLAPLIPFILVTGSVNEETAVECMKAGADDYFLKGNLTRLASAIQAVLEKNAAIKAKIKAEEALRESENKYRTIFENIQDVFYQLDPEGIITEISPSIYKYSGYTREELIGKPVEEIYYDPKDRQKLLEEIQRNGEVADYDVRLKTKEGQAKWASLNIHLLFNATGNPAGMEGSLRDMSQRKLVEESLEQRMLVLTNPITDTSTIAFEDLFNLEEIQRIQDAFAQATGVASVITDKHGIPITKPSNFCNLCSNIIRKTEKGLLNCYQSDATLGKGDRRGPIIQPCLSGGLWDGGASIHAGEHQIANWLIGQVLDDSRELTRMPKEQFAKICNALFLIAEQLSRLALQNIQQARFINEHKRIEEALKESEEKFRIFFEESPIGIEIYAATGIQTAANKASFNMFGIQDESSSGFNLFDGTSLTEKLKNKLRNGEPILYEASFDFNKVRELNQYNTIRTGKADMEYIITPYKSAGASTIQGYILQVQDITERKHSEQLQKVLYNISNAVAITTDLEEFIGKIQSELETLVDTTNFYVALFDETTGLLSTPFYKDEVDELSTWPAYKSATGYVIKTRQSLLAREEDWVPLYKSGEIEEVGVPSASWLGVPLFMEGKAMGALVVQSYDNPDAYSTKDVEMLEFVSYQISLSIQRKKAEQDLLEAMEKALESDTLKSAFLANMSHEIRTPMNAILGFTEFLGLPDSTPEEQEHFKAIIRNAGNKLMRLIDDIIDISKLDAKQITISPSACDVVKLLITTVESYNAMDLLKKKPGVRLQLAIPPATSIPQTETDPYRLQQILDNLLTNAIKFTDQGSIEIGITPVASDHLKSIEFFVKDTGKGIPADKVNIIFERFRQVEGDSYRQGAGLGLSISKALVDLLGGEIRVVSDLGKGTTFYFTIPFRPVKHGEKTTSQPFPGKSLDLNGKIIYVAEDEDDGFDYISLLLKDTHAMIRRADNGDLLMKMIYEKLPDLLLLDINMPGKSGYDCLSEIQDAGFKIRIIAQTAYAMVDEKRRCFEAGCHGYLAKPYTKKGLFETIGNVLKSN